MRSPDEIKPNVHGENPTGRRPDEEDAHFGVIHHVLHVFEDVFRRRVALGYLQFIDS